ncbi:MAG TPA: sugar ABC transporter ATP-binding protein [Spirochaetia bacterium]|nr:sugar ABC transporter ATP-binding protein [Spirochaetia bacterium]
MQTTTRPLLSMSGISKSFPGVNALTGVNFRLFAGEVHALMGENGAGKSTLIKVLTGVYRPEKGEIVLGEAQIWPESPQHAQSLGISTVYQEVNLCPNLTVAENILIGREPMHRGAIDWKEMKKRAETLMFEKLNVDLDASRLLSSYSIAIQQMVAIARALYGSSRILILDEPTSSLDETEVDQLFSVIKRLKQEGLGILFVTHFLDQTYRISDRITVLRNGELVGEFPTATLPKLELISKMIGKEYVELESMPRTSSRTDATDQRVPYLHIEGYGRRGYLAPFNLSLHDHEVIGLAGLLGSGRTEMAKMIFGIERSDTGQCSIDGRKMRIGSPKEAIDAGIGFCPEDRKAEGIIEELTVRENIILALQAQNGTFRFLSRKKQSKIADEYIQLLNISTPSADQPIGNLSGGNQQKVILARWLVMNPKVLILDEPTRGIDVGAKAEIQKLILKLCSEGLAILFVSSELDEVLRVSNLIAVLRDRVKIRELTGTDMNEQVILQAIAHGDENARQ